MSLRNRGLIIVLYPGLAPVLPRLDEPRNAGTTLLTHIRGTKNLLTQSFRQVLAAATLLDNSPDKLTRLTFQSRCYRTQHSVTLREMSVP